MLLTLRGRLLICAVVLWAVLCVTLLTYGWQAGSLLVQETNRQHLRYEAELIRNSITSQIDERIQALEGFAQDISGPARGRLFTQQQAQALMPFFDGVVFFDLKGQVVETWPTAREQVGSSFIDRKYARFMHAFQRPRVSEPFIARVTGRPMVLLLVPVHDTEGRYSGFLGGLST